MISLKKYDVEKGAVSIVSPELGGPGFEEISEELGYITNNDFEYDGSEKAVKGGRINLSTSSFPVSYRIYGKNAGGYGSSIYESLLYLDRYYNYIPGIASHWKISDDKKSFYFRINPDARWSDGSRITTEDIVSTHHLVTDEEILAPYTNQLFNEFRLSKISDYIVKVETDSISFRSFLNFSTGLSILPAEYLNKTDAKGYLEKYQYREIPGSGPYTIDQEKSIKGKRIVLRKRSDYWAEKERRNIGRYNFYEINMDVVLDKSMVLEKFKKGDLDYYYIDESLHWVKTFDLKNPGPGLEGVLDRGLIQKRKIYNFSPHGRDGIVLNMRKKPFDNIDVRKAFAMLYNRDAIIDKLELNEKEKMSSHFPGGVYESKSNEPVEYNPDYANFLLDKAGWNFRTEEGLRKNGNGEVFELVMHIDPNREKYFTLYQEDLRNAGIKLNLIHADWPTRQKLLDERRFSMNQIGYWGEHVPSPDYYFHSKYADIDNSSNLSGIKNNRIDELCDKYEKCFDQAQRERMIQEIDSIAFETGHVIFGFDGRYTGRIAYWNKFGMPEGVYKYNSEGGIIDIWWIDKDKENLLYKAVNDKSISMPIGSTEVDYYGSGSRKFR
ncbi:MAG: hypothetical protein JW870_04450 [Candidatus Delongbacteria bacterium]|nr:hypothetical protein [Candidatus Delongbacteria bacterium]